MILIWKDLNLSNTPNSLRNENHDDVETVDISTDEIVSVAEEVFIIDRMQR